MAPASNLQQNIQPSQPMARLVLASFTLCIGLAMSVFTSEAHAQIAAERTLDELKAEVVLRTERQIYPLAGVTKEQTAEALAKLSATSSDSWADAWLPIADGVMKQGQSATGAEQRTLYRRAYTLYSLARFPVADSPRKTVAYEKAITAFLAFDRLNERPVEVLKIPFEGKHITAYLRTPAQPRPAPVVLFFGGIDFLKEQAAEEGLTYLPLGVAVVNVDIPGTGQAPIKASPTAGRMFSAILDYIATRAELDSKRVIIRGASWGGYWAAKMAVVERTRLIGANSQGGPSVEFFTREWQLKALQTREYLMNLFAARSALYGTSTLEEFLAYGPQMSLQTQGLLDQPSAPMLLVNGAKDSQVPISDLITLQLHGSPKEAVIIPAAAHVGIGGGWNPKRVNDEIVLPWIQRRLASGDRSP